MAANTPSYAANLTVRAFLTNVSKRYTLFRKTEHWPDILKFFANRCAYCRAKLDLQKEHTEGFNRDECGLDHPGNIVPVCSKCNQAKQASKLNWEEFLEQNSTPRQYKLRRQLIRKHRRKWGYPVLKKYQQVHLSEIATKLYNSVTRACHDAEKAFCQNE